MMDLIETAKQQLKTESRNNRIAGIKKNLLELEKLEEESGANAKEYAVKQSKIAERIAKLTHENKKLNDVLDPFETVNTPIIPDLPPSMR